MKTQPQPQSGWVVLTLLLVWLPISTAWSHDHGTYGLDNVERTATRKGKKIICPKVPLARYRGDILRYHSPVRVYEGFVPHLKKFEEVVRDTAIEFYGRAPHRIRHIGTYNCRLIKGYPNLVSEHGMGNGIDIAGFDFKALPRAERKNSPLPKKVQRAFKIRLLKHWDEGPNPDIHAQFFDTLARRLVARKDIFRVLLGPSYPGHKNHFHFDMSPWRMVDIWENE